MYQICPKSHVFLRGALGFPGELTNQRGGSGVLCHIKFGPSQGGDDTAEPGHALGYLTFNTKLCQLCNSPAAKPHSCKALARSVSSFQHAGTTEVQYERAQQTNSTIGRESLSTAGTGQAKACAFSEEGLEPCIRLKEYLHIAYT